eukprot:scaffold64560_cov48-Phaeocystis_antarctica.AAC.1
MVPSCGEVISTVALSLCTSHSRSNSSILSPSFTNHSVISTSEMPSPMSASLKGVGATLLSHRPRAAAASAPPSGCGRGRALLTRLSMPAPRRMSSTLRDVATSGEAHPSDEIYRWPHNVGTRGG